MGVIASCKYNPDEDATEQSGAIKPQVEDKKIEGSIDMGVSS